jgi:hypothetical protein
LQKLSFQRGEPEPVRPVCFPGNLKSGLPPTLFSLFRQAINIMKRIRERQTGRILTDGCRDSVFYNQSESPLK